ncbi:MAG: hypothetical protein M3Y24_09300 [Acidobacteriota bacterium]|nr:hypothetical protein [Acidobacteriota bacterium]
MILAKTAWQLFEIVAKSGIEREMAMYDPVILKKSPIARCGKGGPRVAEHLPVDGGVTGKELRDARKNKKAAFLRFG